MSTNRYSVVYIGTQTTVIPHSDASHFSGKYAYFCSERRFAVRKPSMTQTVGRRPLSAGAALEGADYNEHFR